MSGEIKDVSGYHPTLLGITVAVFPPVFHRWTSCLLLDRVAQGRGERGLGENGKGMRTSEGSRSESPASKGGEGHVRRLWGIKSNQQCQYLLIRYCGLLFTMSWYEKQARKDENESLWLPDHPSILSKTELSFSVLGSRLLPTHQHTHTHVHIQDLVHTRSFLAR